MTPQQANDYSFLPEHPTLSPEEVQRRQAGWGMDHDDITWLETPSAHMDWRHVLAAAAIAFFACMGGWMAQGQVNRGSLAESFNAGMKVGAICAHDPTLSACGRESLRTGGVL